MDRFNFDECLSAIKNGRSLSNHCKPLLVMLAKDVDKDWAELVMLEKFRGMRSASENVQISLEDPDRIIPNNLDDYLAMIERLEERTNATIRIQKGAPQDKLQYHQESLDEYSSHNSKMDKKALHKMRMIIRGKDEDDQQEGGWSLTDIAPKEGKIRAVYQGQPQQNGFYGQSPQCTYCARFGHTIEKCQKRRKDNHEPVEPDWECRVCHRRGVHYTQDCHELRVRTSGSNGNKGNGDNSSNGAKGTMQNLQMQGPRDAYNQAPPTNVRGQPAYQNKAVPNGSSNATQQNTPMNPSTDRAGPQGGCFTCRGPHFRRDCPQKQVAANTNNRGNNRPANSGGYKPAQPANQGNYRRP